MVIEKKILKKFQQIFNNLRGWGTSFEQTRIPFIQSCYVLSLFQIGPVVYEKNRRWKCENLTKTTTTMMPPTTDKGKFQSEKLTRAFGTGEIKSSL